VESAKREINVALSVTDLGGRGNGIFSDTVRMQMSLPFAEMRRSISGRKNKRKCSEAGKGSAV